MTRSSATPENPSGPDPSSRDGRPGPYADSSTFGHHHDFLHVDVIVGGSPIWISVWRSSALGEISESTFRRQLARRIIAVYSRRGTTVVDFDGDPTVRDESIAAGRAYRPVTHAADLAGLDTVEQVDLVVLRWPRSQPLARPRSVDGAVVDLFRALRLVITPDGFAVLLVEQRSAQPAPTEIVRLAGLVPEAHAGGMNYLQHVLAVTTPVGPTADSADADPSAPSRHGWPTALHLLVFVGRAGHRD
ncbi:hypothetical protein [Micromonospora chokoriensis]|uniref:Uncharacterized protein n=1 Tax=Micromonospora chokoriensis TaxID=356851 RepID=A0A1C4YRV9_9ACTN|nr:hypothetical protein [Micromonospora chokoriensis]SCF23489.1 hypothetical protein GA0070612_5152 [Micromonospora chokoriensis]